jgi:ribonuclease VapC
VIALDSSALMAIIGSEPPAEALVTALQNDRDLIISAATLAETLVVADRRNIGVPMRRLIARLAPRVVAADDATAARVAAIYSRWGKGVDTARLNLIDCFSYDVAAEHGCPLLYIGDDFTQTDIVAATG